MLGLKLNRVTGSKIVARRQRPKSRSFPIYRYFYLFYISREVNDLLNKIKTTKATSYDDIPPSYQNWKQLSELAPTVPNLIKKCRFLTALAK